MMSMESSAPANKHNFNHTTKAKTTAVDTISIGSASNNLDKGISHCKHKAA